jgi:large subunit ribosomal protein L30
MATVMSMKKPEAMAPAAKPVKAAAPAAHAAAMKAPEKKHAPAGWLAVVRVRGAPKMSNAMEFTLHHLHLDVRHACIVIADTNWSRAMIKKVNGYVTWGEVSESIVKELEAKARPIAKNAFGLKSPKKGFECKGVKMPFKNGGSLGYRGKDITELIMRML